MVAAGSAHTLPPLAVWWLLLRVWRSLPTISQRVELGYILGTPAMLYKMSTLFKDPIQYTPNDKIADLNLQEYRIGEMRLAQYQQNLGDLHVLTLFANKPYRA